MCIYDVSTCMCICMCMCMDVRTCIYVHSTGGHLSRTAVREDTSPCAAFSSSVTQMSMQQTGWVQCEFNIKCNANKWMTCMMQHVARIGIRYSNTCTTRERRVRWSMRAVMQLNWYAWRIKKLVLLLMLIRYVWRCTCDDCGCDIRPALDDTLDETPLINHCH